MHRSSNPMLARLPIFGALSVTPDLTLTSYREFGTF
jgi:hypothetical protein